ncbi:hypothetical protein DEO72_LG11g1143 [Vigna unguiculata]|uniref:Uncharacterized protein n=1 Tax=Vigna unguiculata TaxID=3917 RepID=A0A4D6NPI6_VIGUN|nr:hypothetical protein DEO72_LG11g1143 [Vigna unguiculata]
MMVGTLEEDQVVIPHIKADPVVGADSLPNNDLAESETLLDSSVEKSDCEPNKDLSNLETQPHTASETLTANDGAVALPNQHLGNSEEPVVDHSNNEASHNSQTVNSEVPPTNANSEVLFDCQLVSSEERAALDKKASQCSNQQVHSEALLNHNVVMRWLCLKQCKPTRGSCPRLSKAMR